MHSTCQAELVGIMQEAGLEVDLVDYGMLSNEQQMVRTRKAAMLVGMHGAGMANLVWLHASAPVLELHPYGMSIRSPVHWEQLGSRFAMTQGFRSGAMNGRAGI